MACRMTVGGLLHLVFSRKHEMTPADKVAVTTQFVSDENREAIARLHVLLRHHREVVQAAVRKSINGHAFLG